MKNFMKKVTTLFWIVLIVAVVLAGAGLVYLSMTEYKPEAEEEASVFGSPTIDVQPGDKLKVMTYSIGSGIFTEDFGLGTGHQGGAAAVDENMNAIAKLCTEQLSHVNFFQQVDIDSKRSYYTDEASLLANGIYGRANSFAPEQKCAYVPFPLDGLGGKVESGSLTLTRFNIDSAVRKEITGGENWPASTWSKKPCLLVERVKLGDTTKELVLINVNFTSTDDGSVRKAQYKELCEFMQMEFAKGSYVIAGGNFSAALPSEEKYKFSTEATDEFTPCDLTTEFLTGGWKFCTDGSAPTKRLISEPYSGDTNVYITDGFITSPNTIVENTKTIDTDFKYSDHDPVVTEVTLVK